MSESPLNDVAKGMMALLMKKSEEQKSPAPSRLIEQDDNSSVARSSPSFSKSSDILTARSRQRAEVAELTEPR